MITESFVVHVDCDNEFNRGRTQYSCTEATKVVFTEAYNDMPMIAKKTLSQKGWKFFDDGKCLCPGCEEFGKKSD